MCAILNNSKRILYLGLDASRYQAKGEVTHWPIIKIVPRPLSDPQLQMALKCFEHYTHVVVTSKSTVAILKNFLTLSDIPLDLWSDKTSLAVGTVTAEHLRAIGIVPARIAKEETAEGLIQEIKQLTYQNPHFFWPHSSQARPVIEEFFIEQGILHTSCILYDPKINIPGKLPEPENYEEIVFTSPSTIDAFLDLFGRFPIGPRLIPIGPVTARHLACKKPVS